MSQAPRKWDPASEPLSLLPLRPWEVRRARRDLTELERETWARGGALQAAQTNLIDAYRRALTEYAEASWHARFRITPQRIDAVTAREHDEN
jgi:hypothetical protein